MRILLVPLLLTVSDGSSREYGAYSSSYVHMSVVNPTTNDRRDFCANYQQFRDKSRALPETFEQADGFALDWWEGRAGETHICPLPERFRPIEKYPGKIIPLNYRIDDDGTACTKPFTVNRTAFRNATQFQEDQLIAGNASAVLFLMDRGRQFVQGWKDYLFSDFYDPYVDPKRSIPTFYFYRQPFFDEILKLSRLNGTQIGEDLEIRLFRPKNGVMDGSTIVIWFLAMICVTGGGVWAFHRHRHGKDTALADNEIQQRSSSDADTFCVKYSNFIVIGVLMAFLLFVIMIGYFFRTALVCVFNVMLILFGTLSIQGCLSALLSNFAISSSGWYRARMEWFPLKLSCGLTTKPTYSSMVLGLFGTIICAIWFFNRLNPYAFILLDFINVTLCLHILKTLRLPSLKWITTLMVCMFVYDAVMVFMTPYWTKNGCSVMLEVATGIDCSASHDNSSGYPLPPIEYSHTPEKFPMLMQVMHFDPMISCIDLSVERGFQMTILGLGDIIIPGYLVSHGFTMNGFDEKARIIYGTVTVIGYGVGLIATFIALYLMKMAQPALIYLVPFTLIPFCVVALIRGEFMSVWNGVPFERPILECLTASRNSGEDGEALAPQPSASPDREGVEQESTQ
ncbi:unnamed protein product [Caenorhabditis bovis]|uniref:Uncharacterized protein n=1 Tax=Caenorhabditis bovis TaxID=2654633 RepID=A0A8S1EZY6_9PELO|nr:unnamed protein product [Caenorhabditis bovis]